MSAKSATVANAHSENAAVVCNGASPERGPLTCNTASPASVHVDERHNAAGAPHFVSSDGKTIEVPETALFEDIMRGNFT